jgi:hypothetical protein
MLSIVKSWGCPEGIFKARISFLLRIDDSPSSYDDDLHAGVAQSSQNPLPPAAQFRFGNRFPNRIPHAGIPAIVAASIASGVRCSGCEAKDNSPQFAARFRVCPSDRFQSSENDLATWLALVTALCKLGCSNGLRKIVAKVPLP